MTPEILVEVGYYDFIFDCMEEAAKFAETAARHVENPDRGVSLTIKFIKQEEVEENGKD